MFGPRPPLPRSRIDGPQLARALLASSLADMPDCRAFLDQGVEEARVSLLVGEHDEEFRRLWGRMATIVDGAHHDVLSQRPEVVRVAARALWNRLEVRILQD